MDTCQMSVTGSRGWSGDLSAEPHYICGQLPGVRRGGARQRLVQRGLWGRPLHQRHQRHLAPAGHRELRDLGLRQRHPRRLHQGQLLLAVDLQDKGGDGVNKLWLIIVSIHLQNTFHRTELYAVEL